MMVYAPMAKLNQGGSAPLPTAVAETRPASKNTASIEVKRAELLCDVVGIMRGFRNVSCSSTWCPRDQSCVYEIYEMEVPQRRTPFCRN
jgi:hypothetical protein